MLVYPQWQPLTIGLDSCRLPCWAPSADAFASRVAPQKNSSPTVSPVDDEDERGGARGGVKCAWASCGARLPAVAPLSAHVATEHARAHPDGLYYCRWESCSRPFKGFNARYKMLVHVRTHTNERPHACALCRKCFSRAENLKIHLRSHSGEKPYICPYQGCGKAYSNSSDRFKHTRTHTVDKPYACRVAGCEKRYTDPSSLRKHVKTFKHYTKRPNSEESNSMINIISTESHGRHNLSAFSLPRADLPYQATFQERTIDFVSVGHTTPAEMLGQLRIPTNEMSYIEYSQMYEHAYRNYYSKEYQYPVLKSSIGDKVYPYKEDLRFPKSDNYEHEEMPLNLKRQETDCETVEDLVKQTDMPLDLSTKS